MIRRFLRWWFRGDRPVVNGVDLRSATAGWLGLCGSYDQSGYALDESEITVDEWVASERIRQQEGL